MRFPPQFQVPSAAGPRRRSRETPLAATLLDRLAALASLLLVVPSSVGPVLAAGALVAWAATDGRRSLAASRDEARTVSLLFVAAWVVRLLVPWGPLEFPEAERLPSLWAPLQPSAVVATPIDVLVTALRLAGLSPFAIVRGVFPLAGALGVVATYAFARTLGLGRPAAVFGALVLLGWPEHVRYSASFGGVVPGVTCWTAAFAAAARSGSWSWRPVVVASFALLGALARPEYHLLSAALVPLAFTAGWTWRDRAATAGLFLLGFLPAARLVVGASAGTSMKFPGDLPLLASDVFTGVAAAPVWMSWLGVLGVVAGVFARSARLAVLLALVLAPLPYVFFGHETNPLWGSWRYLQLVLPFLAVGGAALVAALPARLQRLVPVFAVVSLVPYVPLLARTIDLQAQFRYLVETAPDRLSDDGPLVFVTDGPWGPHHDGLDSLQLAAIGFHAPVPQRLETTSGRFRPASAFVGDGATPVPPGALLFVGVHRPASALTMLSERATLTPIDERQVLAAPATHYLQTECRGDGAVEGLRLADCAMTFGWYRMEPR